MAAFFIFNFENQDIFPDRASERKILDYQVKCPNEEDGCQWIGELRSAEVNVSLKLFLLSLFVPPSSTYSNSFYRGVFSVEVFPEGVTVHLTVRPTRSLFSING